MRLLAALILASPFAIAIHTADAWPLVEANVRAILGGAW